MDITGCSRTDAGVHALKYVCNFKSDLYIPLDRLPLAINTKLPGDIRVVSAEEADEEFNSRYSAHSKTYIYKTVYDYDSLLISLTEGKGSYFESDDSFKNEEVSILRTNS